MWIIKIGGSWLNNPLLNVIIKNLNTHSKNHNIVIICGGGCFADSVRLVYDAKRMSEKTGHYIALKSTEMFASILKEINKEICLIKDINLLSDFNHQLKIWLPSFILKNETSFIKSWESTSDSVAAWLHTKLKSKGLIYVKSLSLEKKKYKLKYLQEKGVLDKNVDKYLLNQKNIKIIGAEIIDLLNKISDWKDLYLNLNEVEL